MHQLLEFLMLLLLLMFPMRVKSVGWKSAAPSALICIRLNIKKESIDYVQSIESNPSTKKNDDK